MAFTQKLKFGVNNTLYPILKYILFKIDAEKVHDFFLNVGRKLGRSGSMNWLTKKWFNYENETLNQRIAGIDFRNPVGLAAGFDYNADLVGILPSVGFGYNVIGSVTFGKYLGNATPRLGRLPKSKALLVNKGLKSEGAREVARKLKTQKCENLWISIAKTNSKKTVNDKDAIEDYIKSLKIFEKAKLGSVYEINISCPNAYGGEAFTTPKKLDKLLSEISKLKIKKPIFLKMPINLTFAEMGSLCNVASKYKITGLVFGNLEKSRDNSDLVPEELAKVGKGNFSGKPTEKKSNALLEFVYKKYGKKFVLVGCGGIFSAEDAYKKIKLGASLVQLITGMIYRGPGVIGEINYGLAKLAKKEGYDNIGEAIGKGVKS